MGKSNQGASIHPINARLAINLFLFGIC